MQSSLAHSPAQTPVVAPFCPWGTHEALRVLSCPASGLVSGQIPCLLCCPTCDSFTVLFHTVVPIVSSA